MNAIASKPLTNPEGGASLAYPIGACYHVENIPHGETYAGELRNMELDEMADLNTSVQAAAPGKIDSHSILFYGRCYSCMEKEETENTLKKSS